jgi:hypothetical protein
LHDTTGALTLAQPNSKPQMATIAQ